MPIDWVRIVPQTGDGEQAVEHRDRRGVRRASGPQTANLVPRRFGVARRRLILLPGDFSP